MKQVYFKPFSLYHPVCGYDTLYVLTFKVGIYIHTAK